MIQPKADFDYEFINLNSVEFLSIVDLNLGKMSVTNNIEDVIAYIVQKEKEKAANCLVVYCDSMGIWDGWDRVTNNFVHLNGESAYDAALKYLKRI